MRGADVGVRAGGRETLVLPDLRADLARQAHGRARQLRGQHLANRLLVGRVSPGVEQSHGDRLDPPPPSIRAAIALTSASSRGARIRPRADTRSVTSRRSGRGTSGSGLSMNTSYCSNRFSNPHLQNVAKPPGGQERRPRALALDEGVGGERRAVDEDGDLGGGGRALLQDRREGFEDPRFGRPRGRQHLGGAAPGGGIEDEVGERAPDIGGHPYPRLRTIGHRSFPDAMPSLRQADPGLPRPVGILSGSSFLARNRRV